MTKFKLSSQQRRQLNALAVRTTDAELLRRLQTLLSLSDGHDTNDIAQRLRVCRRTIYYWVEQFQARAAFDIIGRLSALPRRYLAEAHQLSVSQRSVSYALERLSIRWKRPRHQLALRHPFWRQAKGG